jgi:glycerol-3-phosphate dehydrogenase
LFALCFQYLNFKETLRQIPMKRNFEQLSHRTYDLIIIGGGIYGAFAAWDAALRGLSVALLEKGDFGGATSSNSLKIIHGGLRYLQHADFKRMRESIRERRILMGIAPHLVHPLPCLMPTYGHGLKGREAMAVALLMNDLIGFDRNRLPDPQKRLPRGRLISRDEVLSIVPEIDSRRLTGGALWHDCQTYNSERLLLAVLHAAVAAGAEIANYAEVTNLLKQGQRIIGVRVVDRLTNNEREARARLVLNSSGPWVDKVLGLVNTKNKKPRFVPSKAMNLVVRRQLIPKYAVGLSSKFEFKDADAVLSKGSRLFFITPWRGYSLIGTTHLPYAGDAETFRITEKDVLEFVDQINEAYPPAAIKREEVSRIYGGLLPMDDHASRNGHVTLVKHYRIHDHLAEDGLEGLVTVVGVKYTTARDVAAKSIDVVCRKIGGKFPASSTHRTPVHGGTIERFDEYLHQETARPPAGLSAEITRLLIQNYGAAYREVLGYLDKTATVKNDDPISRHPEILRAEVLYGIREEMAQTLGDVVLRRTELGSAGHPGNAVALVCAEIMATELGWDWARGQREIEELAAVYQPAAK